ncbi:hypothetical protein JTB14_002740 [Gonioctena quinquepunctata]|nr:hypothetical protein JTB14_002740 [Gonioctena quinquepunctata]
MGESGVFRRIKHFEENKNSTKESLFLVETQERCPAKILCCLEIVTERNAIKLMVTCIVGKDVAATSARGSI